MAGSDSRGLAGGGVRRGRTRVVARRDGLRSCAMAPVQRAGRADSGGVILCPEQSACRHLRLRRTGRLQPAVFGVGLVADCRAGVGEGRRRPGRIDGSRLRALRCCRRGGGRRLTETLIRLVTIVDDRPTHFWINGARIIAYDIAEWRLSSPGSARMPAEVRRRIVEEQAGAGLRFLAAAGDCHPDCAAIWVEMGNIQLYRRRDLVLAAECYRRAAELPDAPYYAARIYAELLRRLGRDQDAYAWLCRLHPILPVTDQAAMSELVLRRIRALERRLKVPVQEQYMPLCGIVTASKSAKSD